MSFVRTRFTGFADRAEGGRRLADALSKFRGNRDTIVLGLPRGGVVTAAAVAKELELPLDVLVVRKLGTPGHEELAMGAIGPGGIRILNDDVVSMLGLSQSEIDAQARREQAEVERRERMFRGRRDAPDLTGRTVIVVDDGLATGATMAAAVAVLRQQRAGRIVLAVPVAPPETLERFRRTVDEVVCIESPEPFRAVGWWYEEFAQVSDEEVVGLLNADAR